ncbi:MAG: hypothetical protein COB35_12260 [Gammaproteobacteria bacterium]|nr:MAG: hypothetical protein COB35_12260 [Gammaproteobacteria bacterium]
MFGFVLHYCWNIKRLIFYPMAILTIICSALIATKTAMFASLLLVFLIPIVNERANVFKLTKLKLKLFIPLLIFSSLLIYFILDLLHTIGLYDKVIWVIQEKGVLGLLLSGRIEFSTQIIEAFMLFSTWFEYAFGVGTIGMSDYFFSKYSSEVDPVDLFVYFGVIGSTIVYFTYYIMMLPAFSVFRRSSFLSPIIVLVNMILLLLSFFSGHILNSGMLGLLWGVFNSLVFIKPIERQKDSYND